MGSRFEFFCFLRVLGLRFFWVAWEVAERRGKEMGSRFEFFCFFFFLIGLIL